MWNYFIFYKEKTCLFCVLFRFLAPPTSMHYLKKTKTEDYQEKNLNCACGIVSCSYKTEFPLLSLLVYQCKCVGFFLGGGSFLWITNMLHCLGKYHSDVIFKKSISVQSWYFYNYIMHVCTGFSNQFLLFLK